MTIGSKGKYFGVNTELLGDDKTLTVNDETIQELDPGGSGRDVLLPPEEPGLMCIIKNTADASGEDLTVANDGNTVDVAVLTEAEIGVFVCVDDEWNEVSALAKSGVT